MPLTYETWLLQIGFENPAGQLNKIQDADLRVIFRQLYADDGSSDLETEDETSA